MTIRSILADLDSEIARLVKVRAILAGSDATVGKVGRGKKAAATGGTKRVLSPEARKRIADAQRKRWAAARAKKKKNV